MIASRRRFLFGAGATAATLVAAPSIVRAAANLMPVSTAAQGLHNGTYTWYSGYETIAFRGQELTFDWVEETANHVYFIDSKLLKFVPTAAPRP